MNEYIIKTYIAYPTHVYVAADLKWCEFSTLSSLVWPRTSNKGGFGCQGMYMRSYSRKRTASGPIPQSGPKGKHCV